MNTLQAMDQTQETSRGVLGSCRADDVRPDQAHRAQVCTIIFDLLSAARCGKVAEYLRPMPITRLHLARLAFREIGAVQIASALHAAQFSITRVGVRVPFVQAVATLTTAIKVYAEDVDQLVTIYSQARIARLR